MHLSDSGPDSVIVFHGKAIALSIYIQPFVFYLVSSLALAVYIRFISLTLVFYAFNLVLSSYLRHELFVYMADACQYSCLLITKITYRGYIVYSMPRPI